MTRFTYSKFDVFTLKKIKEDYVCNKSKLSTHFYKDRQAFDNRFTAQKLDPPSWHKIEFDIEENNFIVSAIENRETEIEDRVKGIFLYIYFGRENKEDIAILLKNNGMFKCHFNFNGIIDEKLKEYD